MAQSVTFNSSTYVVPNTGDSNWGDSLTNYLVAIAAGALQESGGSFPLTAEVDFGSSYGLKSLYFKSHTTNPASAGVLRLANTDAISWRNSTNNGNLSIQANASNQITAGASFAIQPATNQLYLGGTGGGNYVLINAPAPSASRTYAIPDAGGSANFILSGWGQIVNADISASAAISLSKLASPIQASVTISVNTTWTGDRVLPSGTSITINPGIVLTINGTIEAGPYQIFIGSGTVTFGSGFHGLVYPEWWGALCDGSNDDALAIQAAANALAHGGIIQFGARPYTCKTAITVTTHSITLQGVARGLVPGNYGGSLVNGTQLIGLNGTNCIKADTVGLFCMRDLSVYLAAGATSACIGVWLSGCFAPMLDNIVVTHFSTAVKLTSCVDTYIFRCAVGSTSVTVSPVVGFDIDCSSHAQNASTYLLDCGASASGYSGSAYAYWLHGNRINDVSFTNCEGDTCTYGFYLDGTAGLDAGYSGDIHLTDCIADANTTNGFYINTCNTDSVIQLDGGWTAGGTIGVKISGSYNVTVNSVQCYGQTTGVSVDTSSKNCVVVNNSLIYTGSPSILVSGSPNCTVADNLLVQSAASGITGISLTSGSTYCSVLGNVANGPAGAFASGITTASGADHCTVIGNSMPATVCTTPYTLNASSNTGNVSFNSGSTIVAGGQQISEVGSLVSNTANPSSGGQIRLANTDVISWRNGGNSGDMSLGVNATEFTLDNALVINPTSNQLVLGSAGSTNFVTITAPTPATTSRIWTIPDITTAGTFASLTGTQTFSGTKTFSAVASLSSSTANPSTAGILRLANTDSLLWRNAANGANIGLTVNASNQLVSDPAIAIQPATNQLILGGTGGGNFVTITAPAPASSRTLTIPDPGTNASFVMNQGSSTVSGTKTFDGQLIGKGTATNDAASTGYIGEYVTSAVGSGAPVTLSSGVAADITNISLTAGDWDVFGMVGYLPGTTQSQAFHSSSLTSATQNPLDETARFLITAALTSPNLFPIPTIRYSVSATTTVYLVAQASFATTCTGFGRISARRAR